MAQRLADHEAHPLHADSGCNALHTLFQGVPIWERGRLAGTDKRMAADVLNIANPLGKSCAIPENVADEDAGAPRT